eukprot:jgi/Mesvir1/25454/Mv01724-RA.3
MVATGTSAIGSRGILPATGASWRRILSYCWRTTRSAARATRSQLVVSAIFRTSLLYVFAVVGTGSFAAAQSGAQKTTTSATTNTIAADVASFCPCWDRASATFTFVMHFRAPFATAGALLRAGVQQAARDRGVQLREFYPVLALNVADIVDFLNAEIQAGTSGIITTLYNEQQIPSLRAAHEAGIPIYIVGGSTPSLVDMMRSDVTYSGPVGSSLRYVGQNVDKVARMLGDQLINAGITHMACVINDLGTLLFFRRCRGLMDTMEAAGRVGSWHARTDLSVDLALFVEWLEKAYPDVPGEQIAVVVMDSNAYNNIKDRLRSGSKGNATLVLYETSVAVVRDILDGYSVMALDPGYYTQGYLALSLAAAEVHTGQAVTSDVETEALVLGGVGAHSLPVIDATLRREVCRAEGYPVCGDPGVAPVSPSGCRCFARVDVKYKVISGLPKVYQSVNQMWQGMVDAQRDLAGSTFDWQVYLASSFFQFEDYAKVANGSQYKGAICLDGGITDLSPPLKAALKSISAAGKALYLAHSMPGLLADAQAFIDEYGAKAYVGASPYSCGVYLGKLAAASGGRHVLGNNVAPMFPWTWQNMRGAVAGAVGEEYEYPPGIWEWPVTDGGSPENRTGAWALFVDPGTNRTAQVMNGILPDLGEVFIPPLSQRLNTDVPAPDALIIQGLIDLISTATMGLLQDIAAVQPARDPILLAMQDCTTSAFLALTRQGRVKGEEHLLGCVDQQFYLSTYLTAHLAALEQHTGERLVGSIDTARLITAAQPPLHFHRRVECELEGYNKGMARNTLGVFYPVCDARRGCVPDGLSAPSDTPPCSGHGDCKFHNGSIGMVAGGAYPMQGSCECEPGWNGTYCQVAALPHPDGDSHRSRVLLAALLSVALALLVVGAAILCAVVRMRWLSGSQEVKVFLRKRAPPMMGDAIAAVVTDIEGSTTLWEWNPTVMNKALSIHHNVLRTLLPKYYGYESDTEGDSFTLVFHDAIDALGWAMEAQRRLLFPAGMQHDVPEGASPLRAPFWPLRRGKSDLHNTHHADWPPELLTRECGKEVKDPANGSVLYRGLRVRMGVHIGMPDACVMHPNGRQHYQGEVMEVAKAVQGAAVSGGQVLMTMVAWNSVGSHMRSVVCHHMGMHEVAERLAPFHIMQVLPHELVGRVPFQPLKSKQLWPSFFEAPCASEGYLSPGTPKQPVVICFIYVGNASILRRTPGYNQAVTLLVAFVESRMAQYEAYEVEEKDGNFLLAFRSPVMASRFAEAIQREAMALEWTDQLLAQDAAAEVVKLAGTPGGSRHREERFVFRGLRLQIGLCMGIPSDCQPHMATGRAAYFGQVVNRAARIAATAAPGQTLANQEVFEGAKGRAQGISFQELGEYGLKVLCPFFTVALPLSKTLFLDEFTRHMPYHGKIVRFYA